MPTRGVYDTRKQAFCSLKCAMLLVCHWGPFARSSSHRTREKARPRARRSEVAAWLVRNQADARRQRQPEGVMTERLSYSSSPAGDLGDSRMRVLSCRERESKGPAQQDVQTEYRQKRTVECLQEVAPTVITVHPLGIGLDKTRRGGARTKHRKNEQNGAGTPMGAVKPGVENDETTPWSELSVGAWGTSRTRVRVGWTAALSQDRGRPRREPFPIPQGSGEQQRLSRQ